MRGERGKEDKDMEREISGGELDEDKSDVSGENRGVDRRVK